MFGSIFTGNMLKQLYAWNNGLAMNFQAMSQNAENTVRDFLLKKYLVLTPADPFFQADIYTKPPECIDIICRTSRGFHS